MSNICSLVLLPPGTHRLDPGNATLAVRTKRGGAAAKAGHDLDMLVTAWEGTLEVGEDGNATSAELKADSTSLRVQKGTGGMQALGEDDKANIHQTIDDEVLKREDIVFRSTRVESAGDGLSVDGRADAGREDQAAHLRARPCARTARSPPPPRSRSPRGA